ncbi:hypothetical protein ACSNOI_03325 [Actinomadura kijaniata]|uniref:hypothetical protein n=1 Tax=Actinomadura kijaniata TaxID=46161 RepID=UPI003F1D0491
MSLSLNAFNTHPILNLPNITTLDFVGSKVVRVEAGGADFVRLRTLSFSMEASHPLLGKVILRMPDSPSPYDNASTLRIAGPDTFTETWVQPMTLITERVGDLEGLNLKTIEPARASATITQYPPPPQGTGPDGAPTGGAFLNAQAPIGFAVGGIGVAAVQLRWQGVNQGQI